jgi:murein DD-endopeptidase MepM/ murein hydrolase activator NlpD
MSRYPHPAYGNYYRRPPSAAPAAARVSTPGTYTFGHGGRQIRFGPIAFWSIVGGLVIMAGWSLVTATYFAFRDDVLSRLVARQAHMQYAYEDRIAELRARVDRLASRQLLDQEQFEQKLEALIRRETLLESRAATLSALPDMGATGSIKPPQRTSGGEHLPSASHRQHLSEPFLILRADGREMQIDSSAVTSFERSSASQANAESIAASLAHVERLLNRVDQRQTSTLAALEENYGAKARRLRGVFGDLGIDPGTASKASGVGGPFVTAKPADASAFERQLHRVQLARTEVDALSHALLTIPVRKPIPGEVEMSSGFGVRVDPFLHGAAMHTGIDLRGDEGEPVRATAAGTVTHAGWSGGYGKMVEVDHGNGLVTRYAHLSAVDVQVGDKVRIGQALGKLGSTGRSTGPHLHYETRVEGEPVDPQKFLRAGLRLGGTQ